MVETATYTEARRKNYDPTHTTMLRNAFANDMKRRFKQITRAIKIGVGINDCFGLKEPLHTLQIKIPSAREFQFSRDPEKVKAFMKWLEEQVQKGILTVADIQQIGTGIEDVWTNKYIADAYKRGVIRARYEMMAIGMLLPTITESGGIFNVIGLPFHMDRLGVLYTRTFTELKGITAAMDVYISRILTQGMAAGDGPALLARKLVAAITGDSVGDLGIRDTLGRVISPMRRAELLARTEIIRAHHIATIQEYRNWGVMGVSVKAEWKTAGDDRVCKQCEEMEGKVFTLDEIEDKIPAHPLCRCISLPWSEELLKYRKK